MDDQTIFLVCVSGAVALGGYLLSRLLIGPDHGKLREGLAGRRAETKKVAGVSRTRDLFQRIGTVAAKPFMPDSREKMSELRRKLSRAGIYSTTAFKMVTGMKLICLLVGLIGGYLAQGPPGHPRRSVPPWRPAGAATV